MIRVSAPGSAMLFGEHAVLHGKRAVACAVSARLSVEIAPREDRAVVVESGLGRHETTLDALAPSDPFRFVLRAIADAAGELPSGFNLRIESAIPTTVGLGSSAAVTVATMAALDAWTGRAINREALARRARHVIRSVQGGGSGADAAASIYGGVIAYRADPIAIRPLAQTPPIVLAYSGAKTPTPEVIRRVEASRAAMPAVFNAVFEAMHRVSEEAAASIEQRNWTRVGDLMNVGQGLMDALGVNTAELSGLVYALRAVPGILGAKISGSGLGDCVVAVGEASAVGSDLRLPDVAVDPVGVQIEAGA